MLEHWREFYLLVGTAAAAMIALLFVAASIGAGYVSAELRSGSRTYMSPVVLHFTSVLVGSVIGLVPSHTRASLALLVGAGALAAGIYAMLILVRVAKNRVLDLADRLAYGVVPMIGYVVGVVAAVLFFLGSHGAPDVFAGALILLLMVNIRNAWDLTLFLAGKQTGLH